MVKPKSNQPNFGLKLSIPQKNNMKYFLLIIAMFGFWNSCTKCKEPIVNECLESSFLDFKKESGAVSIDRYKLKNGNGYWYLLNKNSSSWDGSDPFIDENCKKVCYTCGECIPPSCLDEIDFDKTIWKK